jgi:hypothetical protein
MPRPVGVYVLYAITVFTFALAALCFYWYAQTVNIALLLLGWVTLGTAFDFNSHVLGLHSGERRDLLTRYARMNFAALCFGIPFTALAGSFVIAAAVPDGINASLVRFWPAILTFSLAFGALFLFARYRQYESSGSVGVMLDKEHDYTRVIFIARRVFLALALVAGVLVMYEGFGTDWRWWSLLFGLSFIATVPLHIAHYELGSMLSEAITLVILAWGSWQAFVV